ERCPGRARRDAAALAEFHELAALPFGGLGRPGAHGVLGERLPRVGDDEVLVERDHAAEAAACVAGAERAVEREEVRDRVAHREAAARALERGREELAAAVRRPQADGGEAPG